MLPILSTVTPRLTPPTIQTQPQILFGNEATKHPNVANADEIPPGLAEAMAKDASNVVTKLCRIGTDRENSREESVAIAPPFAIKTDEPNDAQKALQDRFFTGMARMGYSREDALVALTYYMRVSNVGFDSKTEVKEQKSLLSRILDKFLPC